MSPQEASTRHRVRQRATGMARRVARRAGREAKARGLMRPTVSVIVPIYNVEAYLADCLDSILTQSFDDFELLVVDDGSLDGSRAIADEYAARDRRIRVLSRPNGGLGAARNTGVRAARGRYLTFVDSDDLMGVGALERLVAAATPADADIVVGSVRRFNTERTWRPEWTGEVHSRRRSIAAVEEFLPLLRNLYTWNKLFRKTFWDDQGLWFREGVAYEDQPIITQLFVAARRIEVLPDVVYLYRERDDYSSISQQTATLGDLRDRIAAFEATMEALTSAPRLVREGWLATLMDSHFHWYINSPGAADDDYWSELRRVVVELTDNAPRELWDRTPPAKRVVLELVRQGRRDDVAEFVRSDGGFEPLWPARAIEEGVLLELPFFGDPGLPTELFLLRPAQLRVAHSIERIAWTHDQAGRLRCALSGWAYIRKIDLAEHDTHVDVVLVNTRTNAEHVFAATDTPAPLFTSPTNDAWCDYTRGTFAVEVPIEELVVAGFPGDRWAVHLRVKAAGFTAETPVTQLLRRGSAGEVPVGVLSSGEASVDLHWRLFEPLELQVSSRQLWLEQATFEGRTLAFSLAGPLAREVESVSVSCVDRTSESRVRSGRASVTLPAAPSSLRSKKSVSWRIAVHAADGRALPVVLHDGAGVEHTSGRTTLQLYDGRRGEPLVGEWLAGVEAHGVTPSGDDTLVVSGILRGPEVTSLALVLTNKRGRSVGQPVQADADGSFRAEIALCQRRYRFGELPLGAGHHELSAILGGTGDASVEVPVLMSRSLGAQLPVPVGGPRCEGSVVRGPEGGVRISVVRPLGQMRGRYEQRLLRDGAQQATTGRDLVRGVMFRSYFGELATDNGLSIQRELRRRGADLPVYWAVQDHSVVVPDGGIPVVVGSPEWYSLLSSVKYYVDNMYQPENHVKPEGQVIVQTFHGYPFKQMGHPHWRNLGFSQARIRSYDERAAQWDYLVSPARYATPLLQRDFAYEGEVLEVGYPRNDILSSDEAPEIRATVRESLGIRDDQVAVLYAPTFRDYLSKDDMRATMVAFFDFRAAYRLLGDRYVFLVRGHAFNARTSQRAGNLPGTVDVTDYPEVSDLYLAADAAVVDYSSLRFDFGVTGKPMVFHVPDLQRYKDTRGWLFDFEPTAPGPLVDTTEEVVDALRDLDALRARYADAYARFRADFLDLEDGKAAARLVDRVFVPRGDA